MNNLQQALELMSELGFRTHNKTNSEAHTGSTYASCESPDCVAIEEALVKIRSAYVANEYPSVELTFHCSCCGAKAGPFTETFGWGGGALTGIDVCGGEMWDSKRTYTIAKQEQGPTGRMAWRLIHGWKAGAVPPGLGLFDSYSVIVR